MRKPLKMLAPLAAAAVAVALSPAAAHADSGTTYQTRLDELNGSGGSGSFTMTVENGNQATIDLNWSGLASKFNGGDFPHVQHIHIGGQGVCPTPSADKNGDGTISTPEGQPAYGAIGTTLSTSGDTSPNAGTNIKIAPGGSSTDYHRSFTLNSDTVDALNGGSGVVVVHGLNPANLSKKAANAKSPLVPSLPLAATAPALCGKLASMPSGGVATGSGSTSGVDDLGLFGLGGGLLAAGGGALYAARRRRSAVETG